jgi:hypothetical protein
VLGFTTLEAGLSTVLGAIFAGLAVRLFMSDKLMSKDECSLHRENCTSQSRHFCRKIDDVHAELRDIKGTNKRQFDALFRMVRGIIVHSDMGPDTRERILNEQRSLDHGASG